MAPPKTSAILVARSRKTIALPPGYLGFSALVTPEEFEEGKPTYKLNIHYTAAAQAALGDILDAESVAANKNNLADEAASKKVTIPAYQSGTAFVQAKLKAPPEQSKLKCPFIVIRTKAVGKTKDGEVYDKHLKAWDAKNKELDLKGLRLGGGSVIQPIVHANLVYRKVDGKAVPSLDLVGVRVLKLVQWGGNSGAPTGTIDDDELARILGDDVTMDADLSSFYNSTPAQKAPPKVAGAEDTDPDDDIPF